MSGINKITFPLGMFIPGCVVKIKFPYQDDPNRYKERPAIVMQVGNNAVNVLLLKVTSHASRGGYDYTLRDTQMANLKTGSVVRCNHTLTLPGGYKCESIGTLSNYDFINVTTLFSSANVAGDLVAY